MNRDRLPIDRVEYYDDPSAPAANAIVAGVCAIVVDEAGHVLFQRRRDDGCWALPGGAVEIGESIGGAVIREVREETGLDVVPEGIIGVYSDPGHVIAYSSGEVRQQFSVCFVARPVSGTIAPGPDSTDAKFVSPDGFGALGLSPAMALRVQHYLERRSEPYFA